MKKNLFLMTWLLLMFFLEGCKSEDYVTPYEIVIQQGAEIMKCILEQDEEGFRELFCPYMQDTRKSLDREIVKFFDFIEGNIISYDDPEGSIGGGTITEEGISKQDLDGKVENIVTDAGRHYRIAFGSFRVNKENSELEGMMSIKIFDVDTYDKENGYPEGGTYSIYYKDEAE